MAFKTFCTHSSSLLFLFSFKPTTFHIRLRHLSGLKVNFVMNTLYLHNEEGDNRIHVNFIFQNDLLQMNKVLNFDRSLTESIDIFLDKLDKKIEAHYLKKIAKKKKKDNETDVACPLLNPVFLLNDEPLAKETAFKDIIKNENSNLKLRILNNDYNVVVNAPTITKITLPVIVRVGSPVCPQEFETKAVETENCVFTWFKSRNPTKFWEQCGDGFCYIPTEEDLGHFLKLQCVAGNKTKTGLTYEVVTEDKVADFLGSVEIEKRHEYTQERTNENEFRIVSYNILADNYLNTKEGKTVLFNYCDPNILDYNYRKDLLNFELLGYKADLICLQEADRKTFKKNFSYIFNSNGYISFYCEKEGQKEGCGMLCDGKKFLPLKESTFVLTDEILNNPLFKDFKENIENNEKIIERLHNVSTLLQVVVLDCLTRPNNIIVLGNTHLYFHPDADHIRLLQGLAVFRLLLGVIEEFKEKYPNKNISLVLCGDFNSTPECGFHHFLTQGSVDDKHVDWRSKENEEIKNISWNHSLKMKSACGYPEFTNYTDAFKACLDYIYFQTDHLEVKQMVPLPSQESLSHQTAIPSAYFPSDHVALIVDLKFKS